MIAPSIDAGLRDLEIAGLEESLARDSLLDFTALFKPNYISGWFHRRLCSRIENFVKRVEAKDSPRMMIFVPPQHGKSEIVSRNLPPWFFGHHPDWHFISASYNSKLARKFGRDVRGRIEHQRYQNIFERTAIGHTGDASSGSRAADELTFTAGGSYLAVGLGGTTTGLPAHIFSVDDPVKGAAEADSETECENVLDWYLTVAQTRLQRGGGVLITQTRWGLEDLSGQLDKIAKCTPDADQWEIVVFPAIAVEDEEHRKAGEALCDELHSLGELKRARATMIGGGRGREWSAVYQQSPTPESGGYYLESDFRTYHSVPARSRNYVTTDLALGKKNSNDWTVFLPVAIDEKEDAYELPGTVRKRMDSLEATYRLLILADQVNAEEITLPDDNQGKSMLPYITDMMGRVNKPLVVGDETLTIPRRYFTITMMGVAGDDKKARGRPFQAIQRAGRFFWREGPFFEEIVKPELLQFRGENETNDIHDAASDFGRNYHRWIGPGAIVKPPHVNPDQKRWSELDRRKRVGESLVKPLFGGK